jgi:4-diphosphocytidyl-2-C-methyl-D-erythritol kinase
LARGSYEWVLAYAETGLSTAQVYAEFDRLTVTTTSEEPVESAPPEVPEQLMTALRSGDPYAVGTALHNDLEAPALRLRPALRHTLALGEELNALGSILSGSGPTCLFLASDPDHAVDIAVALAGSGTCRLVQRATGPVHGARLVT